LANPQLRVELLRDLAVALAVDLVTNVIVDFPSSLSANLPIKAYITLRAK
jgi:hypothetical protein